MNFLSWFKKKNIIVLLFHGIVNEDKLGSFSDIGPDNHISSKIFEQIISWISYKYAPLSLEAALKAETPNQSGVVLTFDDGFKDNLYVALPILEKYRIPATVYITSGFIDRSVYPFEYQLASIVKHAHEISLDSDIDPEILSAFKLEDKMQIYMRLKNKLKFSSNAVRQQVLRKLDQKFDFLTSKMEYLTEKELLELSQSSLITIGSHTHYHQVLSSIPEKNAKDDIRKGKECLEEWIGRRVYHFSYPYGSYNQKITHFVNDAGFSSAVTTKPGFERCGFKNPMTISRFEIKSLESFHSAIGFCEL